MIRVIRYHPRAAVGDGGMTTAVRRHAEAVAALGARVTIAFDGGVDPGSNGVVWRHVRHVGASPFRLATGLDAVLADADLLVLHSAWTPHNLRAAAAARRRGVPYLLEPRGAYDPHILHRKALLKQAWWVAAERHLVAGSRAVHLFFEEEREHLTALGYHGRTIVSPNGIEPPAGVRWDGGSGGYVLWLGRCDPEHKGLDVLLEAVNELPPAERPMLRLHGPDWRGGKHVIIDRISALGLDRWVELGPPVYGGDKWTLLSRAAGFVYPSRWEGFGNSLAEAASIGVPSLVTPYPFGRFLSRRGAAVLAQDNPRSLAEGLRTLTSPDGARLGDVAAAVVRECFSWEAVAQSWLEQVTELL